jgi:hypothetical protein
MLMAFSWWEKRGCGVGDTNGRARRKWVVGGWYEGKDVLLFVRKGAFLFVWVCSIQFKQKRRQRSNRRAHHMKLSHDQALPVFSFTLSVTGHG